MLLSKSKLWLLDEPLNGIDTKTITILKKIMVQHVRKNGSILFSSHVKLDLKLTKRIILKKIVNKFNIDLLDQWENFQWKISKLYYTESL